MAYNFTYKKVTKLSAVDLDTLFESSMAALDQNFPWNPLFTATDKKKFYLDQLSSAVKGKWKIKDETDTFFMYAVYADNILCQFVAGYIQSNGSFRVHWMLTNPINDSRNWLYTPENRSALVKFYADNSITSYRVTTFIGSSIYKLMKLRANAGFFEIVDEELGQLLQQNKQLVILTIRHI